MRKTIDEDDAYHHHHHHDHSSAYNIHVPDPVKYRKKILSICPDDIIISYI